MNKNKVIIMSFIGCLSLTVGVCSGKLISHAGNKEDITNVSETVNCEQQLFTTEEIVDVKENEYTEVHNEFVNALNEYMDGKISEEDYINICKKINNKMDSKDELSKIEDSEQEYLEEIK